MKKLLFAALISGISLSQAQPTFEKLLGGINNDSVSCVKQTHDGGYIICGSTNSLGAGDYDVYITKMNANGSKSWSKTYGDTGADYGNSILQTSDEGFIITGSSSVSGTGAQCYLIKIDSAGNLAWSETIKSVGPAKGNMVIQTADGGYALVGSSTNHSVGGIYLLKFAPDGAGAFESHFDYQGEGHGILELSGGGFVINGTKGGFADSLTRDILIKTDRYGNYLSGVTYSINNYSLNGSSVIETLDGGLVIGGTAVNSTMDASFSYLSKIDFSGTQLWTKTYNGFEAVDFKETWDQGYVITGLHAEINPHLFLLKTDINGSVQWSKAFENLGKKSAGSVEETNDGGYIVSGSLPGPGPGPGPGPNASTSDMYMIKTDSTGETSCSNTSIYTTDSTITLNDSINYYAGSEYSYTDASWLVVQTIAETPTVMDETVFLIVSKCSPGPPPYAYAENVSYAINESEAGTPANSTDTENRSSINNTVNNSSFFSVYPNPSDGSNINVVMSSEKDEEVLIVVYDMLGKEYFSKVVIMQEGNENVITIDPSGKLNAGIYMIKATSKEEIFSKRLIVK